MNIDEESAQTFNRHDQAYFLRRVLGAGSIVFLISSVLLIALPSFFGELLGLTTSDTSDWALPHDGCCATWLKWSNVAREVCSRDIGAQGGSRHDRGGRSHDPAYGIHAR